VELRVPVNGNNQSAQFVFSIDPPADFRNGVVTWRLRAPVLNNQLIVQPFSNDATRSSADFDFHLMNATNGFVSADQFIDLVYNLAVEPVVDFPDGGDASVPYANDFDKSLIARLGLEIGSAGAFTTAFPGGATVTLLVASVTFTGVGGNVLADISFADSASNFVVNTLSQPPPQPGSIVIHHPE